MRWDMELRSLFPRPFPDRGGDGAGDGSGNENQDGDGNGVTSEPSTERGVRSAARVAVREFLPVVLVLAAVDVSTDGRLLKTVTVLPNHAQPGLGEVYVFAFLGAGAYAMTSLAFNPKESITETYRLVYRMVGALPIGAGVFLLAEALELADATVPVVGVAFLSGLYVRLALRRLGDLAERLYGAEEDARQPYETVRHRRAAEGNLRRCWRHLATASGPATGRGEAVALLERAEAITGDADATHQELVRAHELSERALDRLDLAGEDEPDEDVNATEREAREERVDAAEKRATSADGTGTTRT